jgi:Fic family protein
MLKSDFQKPNGRFVGITYENVRTYAFIPKLLPPKIKWDNELVNKLADAQKSLAELNGFVTSLPNRQILLTSFISAEAILSSQIEGTRATIEDLGLFQATGEERTKDVREVSNHVDALYHGFKSLEKLPICIRMVKELHSILLKDVRGENRTPGEFRRTQVYIASPGQTIEYASFIPPPPKMLLELLGNWEKFIQNNTKIPSLVLAAIMHYQFEAIHPFLDGNGRIGRLLIMLLLLKQRLLDEPVLYLSAYFNLHRQQYYDQLLNVSQNSDWRSWILFFLDGIRQLSQEASVKARKLIDIYDRYIHKYSGVTFQVAELLFKKPIFTRTQMANLISASRPMIYYAIKRLEESGVIISPGKSKYGQHYYAQEILEIVIE